MYGYSYFNRCVHFKFKDDSMNFSQWNFFTS